MPRPGGDDRLHQPGWPSPRQPCGDGAGKEVALKRGNAVLLVSQSRNISTMGDVEGVLQVNRWEERTTRAGERSWEWVQKLTTHDVTILLFLGVPRINYMYAV